MGGLQLAAIAVAEGLADSFTAYPFTESFSRRRLMLCLPWFG
jgi:hypothetical protein